MDSVAIGIVPGKIYTLRPLRFAFGRGEINISDSMFRSVYAEANIVNLFTEGSNQEIGLRTRLFKNQGIM